MAAKPEIDWPQRASRRWKQAEIDGDGPVALLLYCKVFTIELHWSHEEAEARLRQVEEVGCSDNCWKQHAARLNAHQTIDMRIRKKTKTPWKLA